MRVSQKLSKSAMFAAALALGVAGMACSDNSGGGTGTGGKSGTGGSSAGTGGKVGTGGTTAGTGGTTAGTGGATGDAATDVSTDGTTGTGGSDAATDGSTDGATAHLVNFTFGGTTTDGWKINDFAQTGNIGAPDAGTGVSLTLDSAAGDPAGSLSMSGTFVNYNQTLDAIVSVSPMLDLTGKTLHARVRLDSGTVAFAVIHASTTSGFKYKNGTFKTLTTGSFVDLVFALPAADTGDGGTGWDPAQVVQIGIQIGTGDPPTDAGLANGSPLPAADPVTVHIDTVTD